MPTVYVVYLRSTRQATGRYTSFEAAHAAMRDEAAFNDRGLEDYAIRAIGGATRYDILDCPQPD